MKEVTINGVTYLPATVLAKQFRYTTDYIGQLCRSKKVDAQLVGRSWYVNPLSLTAHKSNKYSKSTADDKSISDKDNIEISRIDVQPSLSKNTIKSVLNTPQNFAKRIEWKPAKYEDDESDLFPKVNREIHPMRVFVDLADSTAVTIKTSSKPTDLVADDLPTVSLKGKLNVSSLEEGFEEVNSEVSELDVPVEPLLAVKNKDLAATSAINKTTKRHLHHSLTKPAPLRVKVSQEVAVMAEGESGTFSRYVKFTYLAVTTALVFVLTSVIFAESYVQADALSLESGLSFSTSELSALVSHFLQ